MEREVVRIVTPGTITDEALLEERRERTGLSSMKLGFNGVQGFFIEINRSQAERSPKEYLLNAVLGTRRRLADPLGQVIHRDFLPLLVRHRLLERDDPQIVDARTGGANIELEPRFEKGIVQAGVGKPCLVRHIDLALLDGVPMPVENI
jgi:MutS family domain IV